MSDKKNIVASVLARLRNSSKSSGAPFQQVLQQYAIERFLYRVSKSKHAQGGANDVVLSSTSCMHASTQTRIQSALNGLKTLIPGRWKSLTFPVAMVRL